MNTEQKKHTPQCLSFTVGVVCICADIDFENTSFYDLPLESVDGEKDFLQKFKGKVTLVTNVTGNCGNAPQYGVIEDLYQQYKTEGFEVIAVPTNDYCGQGLTYGEHVYGCENAQGAKDYAEKTYGVTYNFSQLVESNPGPGEIIPGLPTKYGKVSPHLIYRWLCYNSRNFYHNEQNGMFMGGNFEKFLIDKNGKLVDYFTNGSLLNQNYIDSLHKGFSDGAREADIEINHISSSIERYLAA